MTGERRTSLVVVGAVAVAALCAIPQELLARPGQGASSPPRILLDLPLPAVEYQLGRLTNEELVRVERQDNDPRFRPVYVALLVRPGLDPVIRDEAVAALMLLDNATRTGVLLGALSRVPDEDSRTGAELIRRLLDQPLETVRSSRVEFDRTIAGTEGTFGLQAAYVGTMVADGEAGPAWGMAAEQPGHVLPLLRSVAHLPPGTTGDALRSELSERIADLARTTSDPATRAAALDALGRTSDSAQTFERLTDAVLANQDSASVAAAIASIRRLPQESWVAELVDPLVRATVGYIEALEPGVRTDPSTLEAFQLVEALSTMLSENRRRAVLGELRALGVQVVIVETVPEQMAFTLRWFAVEVNARVSLVLANPDAMPHNLIVGVPGSLEELGTAGGGMPMPVDPAVKAFVPDLPSALHATRLVQPGETERLDFTAPADPGEYVFVCTFPGHWVRMYGVMLVVEDLEAWERQPTVPTDPMTKAPFASRGY